MTQRVLVTGGSGFIAGHCIHQLLQQGYEVRTTVRSPSREAAVRSMLSGTGVDLGGLEVVEAELGDDAGWAEAVAGCDYVLHVASPLNHGTISDENELIAPARDGALRVLRAARDAGVKRVVLTSAFATQGFGWGRTDHVFTDDDHSIIGGPGVGTYYKSKILAEKAAFDFIAAEGGTLELTTINPVAVFGPVLGTNPSGVVHLVQQMIEGKLPGYPDFWMPIVDVRDVASAHLLAMTAPDAAGQRFIVYSGMGMTMKQIGLLLKDHLGERGARIPTRSIPNLVVRIGARFNSDLREIAPDLGISKKIDGSKAVRVLGWRPRSAATTVTDTGDSLFAAGLITTPVRQHG